VLCHLAYEDKALIKLIHQQKRWGTKCICKEFPNKNWVVSSVKDLLLKIDKTNLISRKVGSGRKRTVRTTQNIECVAELICSQEGNPGSSKIPRAIQNGTLNSCLLDCFVVVWSFRCFT